MRMSLLLVVSLGAVSNGSAAECIHSRKTFYGASPPVPVGALHNVQAKIAI